MSATDAHGTNYAVSIIVTALLEVMCFLPAMGGPGTVTTGGRNVVERRPDGTNTVTDASKRGTRIDDCRDTGGWGVEIGGQIACP